MFAALEITTGQVKTAHYSHRRRREFLDFMNEIVAEYPNRKIHVVLDNLNTHKPKQDRWLKRHPNIQLHFTPRYASWLNQVECWFSTDKRSEAQVLPRLGNCDKPSTILFPSTTRRPRHSSGKRPLSSPLNPKPSTLIYASRC